MLVNYDSEDSDADNKKKKKKKKSKKQKEPAPSTPVEEPPKVALPSAAELLGDSKSVQYLASNLETDVETFISTLHEGDLVLQVSKPKNSVTSRIEDKERRQHALKISRAKMEADIQAQVANREQAKMESWKRVRIERKDKDGNVLRPPPVDPRGKSIHKYH